MDVRPTRTATVATYGIGVSTGAFSTGAAIAHTNVTGNTTAEIGNVAVGTGVGSGTVGHLGVNATDTITAPTLAIAVAAGVGVGVSGAMAFTNLTGATRASSSAHGSIGSGGVSITALGTHTLSAHTVNVATGIGATGVTVARANQDRDTEATADSTGLTTSGAVLVSSASANTTDVSAPGGAGGGVAITALLAFAILSGDTTTTVDGTFTTTTPGLGITIQATGENSAKAESLTVSVSVVGVNGGVAEATVTGDIEAHVTATSQLSSQGAIVVDAHTTGTGTTASAIVKSAGFGGIAGVAIMFADARVEGDVRAQLDGDVLDADAVTVTANGLTRAVGTAEVLSGSLGFTGTAAGTRAEISGNIEALVGGTSSVSAAGGAVAVTAAGDLASTASSQVGSGGGIAVAVTLPTARVSGGIRAQLAGDVVTGASLTVSASGPLVATATSSPKTLGLLAAVNGVSSEATVSGAVEALIGARVTEVAGANIPDVTVTGAVKVSASSSMTAIATANGVNASGGVGIGIMLPTATVSGATRAVVRDGVDMSAASLSVEAGIFDNPLTPTDETDAVDYSATATTYVVGVGAFAAAAVVNADATVSGVIEAYIGAPLTVAAGGAPATNIAVSATKVRALGTMVTNAKTDGTGFSLGLSVNVMIPTARTSGTIRAYAGQGADIVGSTLAVTADAPTMTATAETVAISVGLGAGNVVNATAIVQATVDAHIGAVAGSTPAANSTVVNLTGDVDVAASSTMTANATANGGAGGAISVAVMLPSATVSGVTRAYVGEGTNLDAGTLDVTAAGVLQANATTKAIGIGLLGSAQGLRSEAIVTGVVESFVGAQATNTVGVLTDVDVSGATNVTADGTMKAIALANGLGASLTAAINIMLPSATDSGRTAAYVRDGVKLAAGSLQVRAGQLGTPVLNLAQATSNSLTGGLLGSGSLVKADAVVNSTVEAYIGAPGTTTGGSASATIVVDNAIVIGAYSDTQAIAKADGTGASAGLTISIMLPTADAAGITRAFVGQGVDITADSLDIDANGALDAKATSFVISVGGLLSGTGAYASATVSGLVDAHLGSAAGAAPSSDVSVVNVTGAITIDADAAMTATPTLTAVSVGTISVSALFPTTFLRGIVRAYIGEGVNVDAGSVRIEASAPTLAAIASVTGTGFAALIGIGVFDADAINTSQVEAFIGAHRSINASNVTTDVDVNAGTIEVLVDTSITASATADSLGFSGVATISAISPTARTDGYAGAYVRDGVNMDAGSLTIRAGTTADRIVVSATATTNAASIGGLLGGAFVRAEAVADGTVAAFVGAAEGRTAGGAAGAKLSVDGVVEASSASDIDALATIDSATGGAIALGILVPTAWALGHTLAYAGGGTNIEATSLTLRADSDVRADATTFAIGVGLAALGVAGAEAIVASTTEAFLGKRASEGGTNRVSVAVRNTSGGRGTIDIDAISKAVAKAQNDGVKVGGLVFSSMTPLAKVSGSTSAYIGPRTDVFAGNVTIDANDIESRATATTLGVTVGVLTVSNLETDATVSRATEAYVGDLANLNLAGFDLTLTAQSPTVFATTSTKGGTGGLLTVTVLTSKSTVGDDTNVFLPVVSTTAAFGRAIVTTRSVTRAFIGTDAIVGARNVTLDSDATATAESTTNYASIGGFVGVSVTETLVTTQHDTEAFVGDGAALTLTGALNIDAKGILNGTPTLVTVGLGGIQVGVFRVRNRMAGAVLAAIGDGADVSATGVHLHAEADNQPTNAITTVGLGLVTINVISASAEDATTVVARIGPSGAGDASDRTVVTANGSGGITVEAELDSDVTIDAKMGGISVGGVLVANLDAKQEGLAAAVIGAQSNVSGGSGGILVDADYDGVTTAHGSSMGVALLIDIAVVQSNAKHTAVVQATVAAGASLTATSGGAIAINADHNDDIVGAEGAVATANNASVAGLGSVTNLATTATSNVTVTTTVAAGASLSTPTGAITVTSASRNLATAMMKSFSIALVRVSIGSATPNAEGTTETLFLGSVGTAGAAGAASLIVSSSAFTAALGTMNASGGGLVSVGTANVTATATPTLEVEFGDPNSVVNVTGAITIVGSQATDSDATAKSATGGLVEVNDYDTTTTATPTVDVVVHDTGLVRAGGTITIQAIHGGDTARTSDGTILSVDGTNAATMADANFITLTYQGSTAAAPHGLGDGSTITYSGSCCGLTNGRSYGVLVRNGTSIHLGAAFEGSQVDTASDTITFGTSVQVVTGTDASGNNTYGPSFVPAAHHLVTGDLVYYWSKSGTAIGGLTSGTRYKVTVIDPTRVKLLPEGDSLLVRSVNGASGVDDGTETILFRPRLRAQHPGDLPRTDRPPVPRIRRRHRGRLRQRPGPVQRVGRQPDDPDLQQQRHLPGHRDPRRRRRRRAARRHHDPQLQHRRPRLLRPDRRLVDRYRSRVLLGDQGQQLPGPARLHPVPGTGRRDPHPGLPDRRWQHSRRPERRRLHRSRAAQPVPNHFDHDPAHAGRRFTGPDRRPGQRPDLLRQEPGRHRLPARRLEDLVGGRRPHRLGRVRPPVRLRGPRHRLRRQRFEGAGARPLQRLRRQLRGGGWRGCVRRAHQR